MKIKAIVLAFVLSLMLFAGNAYANLNSSTDSLYPIRVDQLTYGQSPVWKVTNFGSSGSFSVRFAQPSGFTATLFLGPGESTALGNFEPFREWTCPSGYTSQVVATGAQPTYADYVAGIATHCSAN
jgi:hypothetical protein